MPINNKDIASLLVKFLQSSLKKDDVPEDNKESIEFAIDSVSDAFQIDDSYKSTAFAGKSLQELLEQALKASNTAASSGLSTPDSPQKKDAVPVHIDQSDEKLKEQAEALKLEGNKFMAKKDFESAISKYTAALELIPTNAVYLSNRAAAYSSIRKHDLALQDAEKATVVEPTYAKAWSRMGLAKYALGNAKGAMEAYEQGINVEGDKPSDAMKRGYETAKKKVAQEMATSLGSDSVDTSDVDATPTAGAGASAGAGAGGMPDLSSLLGGLGGAGAGAGAGGLGSLLNNPQVMQAAQQMMQNPDAMAGLMNNPRIRQMAESMGMGGQGGSGPNLEDMMNNPMLQNMARQFMGGNGGNGAGSGSGQP